MTDTSKLTFTPEEFLKMNPPILNVDVVGKLKIRRKKYLDNKVVFYDWIKYGSSGELYTQYIRQGIVSPNTGFPIQEQTILSSIFSFVIHNFEESMQAIKQAYLDANELYDEEVLTRNLIAKIFYAMSFKPCIRFIVENKLYLKYFNAIPKKFGLNNDDYQKMLKSNGDYDLYRVLSGTAPKRVLEKVRLSNSEEI